MIKIKCCYCEGTGISQHNDDENCTICSGKGYKNINENDVDKETILFLIESIDVLTKKLEHLQVKNNNEYKVKSIEPLDPLYLL